MSELKAIQNRQERILATQFELLQHHSFSHPASPLLNAPASGSKKSFSTTPTAHSKYQGSKHTTPTSSRYAGNQGFTAMDTSVLLDPEIPRSLSRISRGVPSFYESAGVGSANSSAASPLSLASSKASSSLSPLLANYGDKEYNDAKDTIRILSQKLKNSPAL
jgi:hypothetical protein